MAFEKELQKAGRMTDPIQFDRPLKQSSNKVSKVSFTFSELHIFNLSKIYFTLALFIHTIHI